MRTNFERTVGIDGSEFERAHASVHYTNGRT